MTTKLFPSSMELLTRWKRRNWSYKTQWSAEQQSILCEDVYSSTSIFYLRCETTFAAGAVVKLLHWHLNLVLSSALRLRFLSYNRICWSINLLLVDGLSQFLSGEFVLFSRGSLKTHYKLDVTPHQVVKYKTGFIRGQINLTCVIIRLSQFSPSYSIHRFCTGSNLKYYCSSSEGSWAHLFASTTLIW